MQISWTDFEEMLRSVNADLESMRSLAEMQRAEDRSQYNAVCQRIIDVTSRMLESSGDYTPDISCANARQKWQVTKDEVRSIRAWVLQNKGSLWRNT